MDSTTKMLVNDILKRGWYEMSQTLGEGGWKEVYAKKTWKTYCLSSFSENAPMLHEIKALNDECALKAFASIYRLDEIEQYDIYEKIITYRTLVEK